MVGNLGFFLREGVPCGVCAEICVCVCVAVSSPTFHPPSLFGGSVIINILEGRFLNGFLPLFLPRGIDILSALLLVVLGALDNISASQFTTLSGSCPAIIYQWQWRKNDNFIARDIRRKKKKLTLLSTNFCVLQYSRNTSNTTA